MINTIEFYVPGEARGQGRPRATIRAGHASIYETAEDRNYKGLIQFHASVAMENAGYELPIEPQTGFDVSITVIKRIPKSFSRKRYSDAFNRVILPLTKPDLDNIAKIFLDGMNGVVYSDDRLVTALNVRKLYGISDAARVTVTWESDKEDI